jgi:hypothetical protein
LPFQAIWETHRLSRDDQQSGHSGLCPARFRARKGADGQIGGLAEAAAGRTTLRRPFLYPDYSTAENTFVQMYEYQAARWKKTPLTTNTQPAFSKVGNSELVDRTIRGGNWLRTDTIFIENEQIEALSNRPQ